MLIFLCICRRSAVLRADLDRPAAKALVDAVRDGQHCASLGRAAQRLKHTRLGLGVEIGGDLVEQQHGGIRRRSARNGQKLPLALRKQPVRTGRIIAVRQRADDLVESCKARGLFRHGAADARIAQRDLVEHRARHAGKVLLHAADARAALCVCDGAGVRAADGDAALLRAVEPQQQAEDRALARARAANERDLFALPDREGQIPEHRALAVAEGHVRKDNVSVRRRTRARRGDIALRLGEEGVDAPDARHRGLNGLDLHAETLDGGEDAGDIVDDDDGRADGHAEQRQHARVAGGGEQHHRADHRRAQHEHDRGIDRVIEVRALDCGVALADAAVVAL